MGRAIKPMKAPEYEGPIRIPRSQHPDPYDGLCEPDEDRPWMEAAILVAVFVASASISITIIIQLLRFIGVI